MIQTQRCDEQSFICTVACVSERTSCRGTHRADSDGRGRWKVPCEVGQRLILGHANGEEDLDLTGKLLERVKDQHFVLDDEAAC